MSAASFARPVADLFLSSISGEITGTVKPSMPIKRHVFFDLFEFHSVNIAQQIDSKW
jgi:hypothetical protein